MSTTKLDTDAASQVTPGGNWTATQWFVGLCTLTPFSLTPFSFGNNVMDRSEGYVESNYGYAKGYSAALKRMVSA